MVTRAGSNTCAPLSARLDLRPPPSRGRIRDHLSQRHRCQWQGRETFRAQAVQDSGLTITNHDLNSSDGAIREGVRLHDRRELRQHWQRACKLVLANADVAPLAGRLSLHCARVPLRAHFLPGTRYAFCALEALSAIALNSAPVQALAVVTSEIVPAAAAASNEAMMFSASLHSEMSRKSESPVVK